MNALWHKIQLGASFPLPGIVSPPLSSTAPTPLTYLLLILFLPTQTKNLLIFQGLAQMSPPLGSLPWDTDRIYSFLSVIPSHLIWVINITAHCAGANYMWVCLLEKFWTHWGGRSCLPNSVAAVLGLVDGNSLPALQRTCVQSHGTTKVESYLHFWKLILFCLQSWEQYYWLFSILNYLKLHLYQSVTDFLTGEKICLAWAYILNELKLKRQMVVEVYGISTSVFSRNKFRPLCCFRLR